MTLNHLLAQSREILSRHYAERFRGLVLFGSQMGQQATQESDIDLLVLLDEPFSYFEEQKAIVEALYPLQLDSDTLLSAKPASWRDYESGSLNFYRIVRRGGRSV